MQFNSAKTVREIAIEMPGTYCPCGIGGADRHDYRRVTQP